MDPEKKVDGNVAVLDEVRSIKTLVSDDMKAIRESVSGMETRLKELEGRQGRVGQELPVGDKAKRAAKGEFSFFRFVRSLAMKDRSIAKREWEIINDRRTEMEEQKRALDSTVDSAGGYLIPAEYLGDIIDLLRANSVLDKAGARKIDNLKGSPVPIPKLTSGSTAYWGKPNVAVTASQQALGQLVLTPHRLGDLVEIDNQLLKFGGPGAEEIVQGDIAKVMALAFDQAGLRGTGSNSEPLGIINTAGIGTVTLNANPTWKWLNNMMLELEAANVNTDATTIAWAMTPRTFAAINSLEDSQGRPIVQTDPTQPRVRTILGLPAYRTTQLRNNLGGGADESEVLLADFSDAILASWGMMEIAASSEAGTSFAADQTWIRAILYCDVGVRRPASFVYCVDVRND